MILEICAGSWDSALAAKRGGAHRVELCSGLDEGGLTPSWGLIDKVCGMEGIQKHVLIRPRGGDFLYSDDEKDIILRDIEMARSLHADGVVVGALLADGNIDLDFLHQCVAAAQGMNVTFHRAFDLCANPFEALEQIISAGCNRLLTSGQASTALDGADMLQKLVEMAGSRLAIMPGCGVTPENAAAILTKTGAKEIHASARSLKKSVMKFRHEGVEMGKAGSDEYSLKVTDEALVRKICAKISKCVNC